MCPDWICWWFPHILKINIRWTHVKTRFIVRLGPSIFLLNNTMTLQTVSNQYSEVWLGRLFRNSPDGLWTMRLDFAKNCILQPIWVNSLWLIQQHNESQLAKNTPGVSQVQVGWKDRGSVRELKFFCCVRCTQLHRKLLWSSKRKKNCTSEGQSDLITLYFNPLLGNMWLSLW